jgi:hypothetical protein
MEDDGARRHMFQRCPLLAVPTQLTRGGLGRRRSRSLLLQPTDDVEVANWQMFLGGTELARDLGGVCGICWHGVLLSRR